MIFANTKNSRVKSSNISTQNNGTPAALYRPTMGVTRTVLVALLEAYDEDEAPTDKGDSEVRVVMRFTPASLP